MAKSKYPEKIDSSVELPHVRDNILEVGSDVINSIRTAIFQIEKTLGTNPQGAAGNSVSSRLSRSIDARGNIKKEALDRANVLSGPIIDADISKVAAIQESKLKLDFPTQLLQDEFSILNRQIQSIIDKVDELNYILSTHVSIEATNRHKAKAITVEEIGNTESSVSTNSLEESTLQSALETIYSSHINYSGEEISKENSSHEAEQIFFDSTNILQVTSEDDVQGAIEDIAQAVFFQAVEHQDLFHTNGALRNCVITRDPSSELGVEIVEETGASFSMPSSTDSSKTSDITFSTPVSIDGVDASKSDIVMITDGTASSSYEIESFTLSSDLSSIESVSVFGTFIEDSSSDAVASISKNTKAKGNKTSLLATAREVPDSTSSSYLVQVCNPNSSAIITDGIRPLELTSLSKIEISVDGSDTSISLDLYDSSFDQQSIDTVISKINEQVAENSYMFSAYRLDLEEGGSELVIAHNLGSSADFDYTLEVTGGVLDGTGLSDSSGIVKATYGNKYFIQGYPYQGMAKKLDVYGSEMSFSSGVNYILSIGGDLDFKQLKIYAGDLITIINSDDDNGTYVISSVSSDQIVLSEPVSSVGFSGISSEETRFLIYSNSVSFSGMEFNEIDSSSSAMVVDVFINSDQEIYLDKRIEYSAQVNTKFQSLVTIVDFEGSSFDIEMSMIASTDSYGNAQLVLDDGEPLVLTADRSYEYIRSGKYNVSLKILIDRVSDILSEISTSSTSSLEFNIYMYPSVNSDTNLAIARVSYDNFRGEITGSDSRSFTNDKQARRIERKLVIGNTGIDEITSEVKEKLIYDRFSETRSNGVVSGLVVSNVEYDDDTVGDIYTFDISAGVVYVSGKRFDIPLIEGFMSGIPSSGGDSVDNFYIAVDEYGNIIAKPAGGSGGTSSCESPFGSDGFAVLASVEKSGSLITEYDLRLLISDLDNRILNAISVSPIPGMGHFREISKALKYAKRFSDVYPGAGTPTIHLKSGVHSIVYDISSDFSSRTNQKIYNAAYNDGIWINFPVNIVGEGDSTVLDMVKTYSDYPASGDDRKNSGNTKNEGYIYIAGPGLTTTPTADPDVISSGKVLLKDFSMRLCGINILDPRIEDDDLIPYNSHVVIDSVKFDLSEKTSFDRTNMGVVVSQVNAPSSERVGNITIENCNFVNSLTRLREWPAKNWYYFRYNNNFTDPLGGESHYPIYQDSQEDNEYDHIMQADRYYYTTSVTSKGEEGRTGRYNSSQFITAIGNVVAGDSGPYWDPELNVPFGSVIAEATTYIDSLEVPYYLQTRGSVRLSNKTDGGSNFYSWLDSTFYNDVKLYGNTIIGSSSVDDLKINAKTWINTASTKGIGIGVEDFLPHPSGGSVVHLHENSDNRAYMRFTNATTGNEAADAEDEGGSGPGLLVGISAKENGIFSLKQKNKDITFSTTDGDGTSNVKLTIDQVGNIAMRSGSVVDGVMKYAGSGGVSSPDFPLDLRGYKRAGYIASIFNECSETVDGISKGDVLLLGVNHYRPSYQTKWIKFTALNNESAPSSALLDTVGGVRGTLGDTGNDGVDIKAAFFNFCDARMVGSDLDTWLSNRETVVDVWADETNKEIKELFPSRSYNYSDAPQLNTPRWLAAGDGQRTAPATDGTMHDTTDPGATPLNPTTRAHPMIVLGGNSGGDSNSQNNAHYWSKTYGGRGVQYYTGAQDFGEWLKIGDIHEWPEILNLEAENDDDSDIITIDREIFGLEEGMVVYIREAMIWREGPGTPMVVTNRACLVGNATWKDDGFSGEVVSFMGQVPVVISGDVDDGDYLLPEENHCIAIKKEDITFDQYKRVIGTAWNTIKIIGDTDGEFTKVLCAIGVK